MGFNPHLKVPLPPFSLLRVPLLEQQRQLSQQQYSSAFENQSADIHNLAAVILAKRLLEAVDKDTYSTDDYCFNRQGEMVTINALDGRGKIARITNGVVTGNLNAADISQVRQLSKTVPLKEAQVQQQQLEQQQPNSNKDWEIGAIRTKTFYSR